MKQIARGRAAGEEEVVLTIPSPFLNTLFLPYPTFFLAKHYLPANYHLFEEEEVEQQVRGEN